MSPVSTNKNSSEACLVVFPAFPVVCIYVLFRLAEHLDYGKPVFLPPLTFLVGIVGNHPDVVFVRVRLLWVNMIIDERTHIEYVPYCVFEQIPVVITVK